MSVELLNECGADVDGPDLVAVARHALDRLGVSPLAAVTLVLVDLPTMERYHVQFMGEPGPTDVLSFPMDELDLRGSRGVAHDGAEPEDLRMVVLGDVLLSPDVASAQAAEAGHGLQQELQLLTTHGVLHLLGYDHAEPEEHAEMFGLQDELLSSYRGATHS